MSNTDSYKYINLLIKLIVGVIALWFIYYKLKEGILLYTSEFTFSSVNFSSLFLAIALLFLNWGIESYKWKISIQKIQQISLPKAIKITFTAITASLITPNRIGEIPVRALLLDKSEFKKLTTRTIASSFSQLIITIVLGTIGFALVYKSLGLKFNSELVLSFSILASCIALLIYFNTKGVLSLLHKIPAFRKRKIAESLRDFKVNELLQLLVLSFLRYLVFSFQFYLVLYTFGIELKGVYEWLLICVCFLFASIIPTFLISEIGVRGSVALLIFSAVSDNGLMIVVASVSLWLINVGLPAIIGLFNINQLKLIDKR